MGGQKQKSIIVGTFGANTPNANVPEAFIGNKIWYSPTKEFFLITDENNKPRNRSFDMKRFRGFVDSDVVIFTSSSVEAYMIQLLEQWEESNLTPDFADPFATDGYNQVEHSNSRSHRAPQSYDAEYTDHEQSSDQRRRSNRQDDHPNNWTENKAITQKDPTKYLGVFMALSLIFAIIIVIVILFGEPIVQAVAPLLS